MSRNFGEGSHTRTKLAGHSRSQLMAYGLGFRLSQLGQARRGSTVPGPRGTFHGHLLGFRVQGFGTKWVKGSAIL